MLKRVFVVIFILFSVLTIGYAYYNVEMKAASVTYHVGGNVTGRINMATSSITGSHIGLQSGDHIMIGGDNNYTGNPLSFQFLFYDENYTDYNNTDVINVVREPISNWVAISDNSVVAPFVLQNLSDAHSLLTKIGHYENNDVYPCLLYTSDAADEQ